ncbi:MAG: VTT domain-containing protein [Acidiphilium sp.]|nr:VTT domain-containing protein [Acidiphilium sp.]MDD4934352.1 VTT domain-containing protein [Acidiphilium sp.]
MRLDRRLIAAGVVLAALTLAAVASLYAGSQVAGYILAARDRLRDLGLSGWLVFIVLQMLAALVGLLPASLLGIAAGAVFGVALGFGLASAGVLLGAGIAFGLARSTLRPAIIGLLARSATLDRFDAALGRDGWRLVLLLRISPVMPFSLTSYALGLSAIGIRDYALGTLAALPALLLYVSLGALGATGLAATRGDASLHAALFLTGLAATALLGVRLGRILLNTRAAVLRS